MASSSTLLYCDSAFPGYEVSCVSTGVVLRKGFRVSTGVLAVLHPGLLSKRYFCVNSSSDASSNDASLGAAASGAVLPLRGHGMSNCLVKLSTVCLLLVTLLTVSYSGFLLLGMDWGIFLLKIKAMVLSRSFHFLFRQLGWCAGGLIFSKICDIFDPENVSNMMAPGASSSEASVNQNQGPLLPAPQPQPPAESAGSVSPSPSASSSSSGVSLIGHASDETNSDKEGFFSAKSKYPAASSPGNQSDDSSPQKESLEFLSENLRKFWTSEIIRAFNEGLEGVDPRGKIGKIPENEIVDALKLDSPLLSREEAENICSSLRKMPWPSCEEADRTSVYARVWMLLEKHQRPDIY